MDDEEASSITGDTSTAKAFDPTTTQRKHAAMIERLSYLHQSRLSSKSNPDSSIPPSFESTQSFLSLFSDSKHLIESNLTRIQQTPDPNSNPHLKSDLENVSLSISHLEKLVADNSYFLPSYEVRTCLKAISDLKQTLDTVTSQVIPKKKFSFKNKPTKKADTNVVSGTPIVNSNVVEEQENLRFKVGDSPGLRNEENKDLGKEFRGDSEENGEFMVSDLKNCEVRLKGCLRALFMNRLQNCRVYVGPVLGSILIEEVEGCVFVLASHQIRIHKAKGSEFYVRTRSRPIIEESGGVRFGPYCLCYDGIESDLKESNLDEETGNWANVDDFQWLRAVQSPNWSVLPQGDRIDPVHI